METETEKVKEEREIAGTPLIERMVDGGSAVAKGTVEVGMGALGATVGASVGTVVGVVGSPIMCLVGATMALGAYPPPGKTPGVTEAKVYTAAAIAMPVYPVLSAGFGAYVGCQWGRCLAKTMTG